MTVPSVVTPATVSMLLAMVDMAKHRRYANGVLGVLADPRRAEPQELLHDGQRVRIRPAESALAVREALMEHVDGDWLVVITDRDDQDLGAGILAHFVGSRLWRPDAWEALRQSFSASGVAPALASRPGSRELAMALLAARPPEGWPPAPAGVLTRAHAMTSVARTHLGLVGDVMDAITVLGWSALPQAQSSLAELRADYGETLADAMIEWIAEATGPAAQPIRKLLQAGAVHDLVPLGLTLNLITADGHALDETQVAQLAAVRLEQTLGKPLPHREALAAHGTAAVAVLADLARTDRNDAHVGRILARADLILNSLDAASLAIGSDVLPAGFAQRLSVLADALTRGTALLIAGHSTTAASLAIESAWTLCTRHRLARRRTPEALAFDAAVKLWRWLTTPDLPGDASFATRVRAHLDDGAWADLAVNDVDTGVDDTALSAALRTIFGAAVARRDREERAFAQRLADITASDTGSDDSLGTLDGESIWRLESVLKSLVLPMAKHTPVLLVVMDGMSSGASNEIVADVTGELGWVEAGTRRGSTRRAAAVAVLPSVTEVSRASLLCGTLQRGGQDVERLGYEALTAKAGKIHAELFHKKGVDTTRPGALVADGVGAAIDDREGSPLVTVVLNTIDDALDRSDPMGTVWNADAVKHLAPLLARARAAGRTVIMTSDHGYVVERRRGTQRSASDLSSGRSRGTSSPAQQDEVAVEGRRVLTDDNRAVLAVSESLRYGPLKAGYHGGASAQEVVVPVIVLLPDEQTNDLGLPLLPPQAPSWWSVAGGPSSAAPATLSEAGGIRPPSGRGRAPVDTGPTLFDHATPTDHMTRVGDSLGTRIVATELYAAQRKVLSRLPIRDEQVQALVDGLSNAPGQRLPRSVVAATLGVPVFRVDGALSQVRQLLNIEGYNVVGIDPDGQTIVLDMRLLRDQFEVG
jgi:hypothetical protein